MPDYNTFPAVDEDNNFPPEILAQLAVSSELRQKFIIDTGLGSATGLDGPYGGTVKLFEDSSNVLSGDLPSGRYAGYNLVGGPASGAYFYDILRLGPTVSRQAAHSADGRLSYKRSRNGSPSYSAWIPAGNAEITKRQTAPQDVNPATWTNVEFNTLDSDPYGMASTTNASRINTPFIGRYLVRAQLAFNGSAISASATGLRIVHSGTLGTLVEITRPNLESDNIIIAETFFTATDTASYLYLQGIHNAPGVRQFSYASFSRHAALTAVYLGPS